jgi:hypothetical protein
VRYPDTQRTLLRVQKKSWGPHLVKESRLRASYTRRSPLPQPTFELDYDLGTAGHGDSIGQQMDMQGE